MSLSRRLTRNTSTMTNKSFLTFSTHYYPCPSSWSSGLSWTCCIISCQLIALGSSSRPTPLCSLQVSSEVSWGPVLVVQPCCWSSRSHRIRYRTCFCLLLGSLLFPTFNSLFCEIVDKFVWKQSPVQFRSGRCICWCCCFVSGRSSRIRFEGFWILRGKCSTLKVRWVVVILLVLSGIIHDKKSDILFLNYKIKWLSNLIGGTNLFLSWKGSLQFCKHANICSALASKGDSSGNSSPWI